MAYNRPPAWRYLPPTDAPPQPLQQVADAMVELGGWFNEEFWTGAGTDGRINTKLITKQLESYLPADPAGVLLEGGLLRGWNVETRDSLARIPLLYGENGKPLYGVNPDAIYADDDGYRALLEIEGGGAAVQDNRLMKDVVETLLIPGAHHLALAVPHSIHGRSPYDFAINLISARSLARLDQACAGRSFAQRRDTAIIAVFKATGIRLSELAGLLYDPGDPRRSDIGLWQREITVRGKGGKPRIVKIGHQAARSLDRYLRARTRHAQAWRNQLWLGTGNLEPLTSAGIYQMIARRGRQCGVAVHPHRFRHHFSHTWLDRGGPEGDLMELNGWASPQMLRRYGASARSARARRTYDRIMTDT